jgi:hypothetical protein
MVALRQLPLPADPQSPGGPGFLSFPVTMNFLSPYVIIDAAQQGIVIGAWRCSADVRVSAFLGRAWCGWVASAADRRSSKRSTINR